LSAEARRVLSDKPSLWANALGGGDDYELAIAVSPRKRERLLAASRAAGVKVTRIGAFTKGRGVVLTVAGHAQRAAQTGYTHF
jgi:thiamine-monophosphate kinase